jgi:uncharacterized iron-regulated membrane protein
MRRIRPFLFWIHLTAGIACGAVILVMSVTGALLALKPQILDWIERDARYVQAQSSPRLMPNEIAAAVRAARADAAPASLTIDRDPNAAAVVNLGAGGNVYVDPYSGAVRGGGSTRANQFFQQVTAWHRYLGAEGNARATGRMLTGISNLAFLLLAVTGLFVWWPRSLTLQHLRPIAWFRSTSGRARDFNWHNTIGFWCLAPIVVMTASGAVISFPWASNLVYRVTGSPVPAPRGAAEAGNRRAPVDRRSPANRSETAERRAAVENSAAGRDVARHAAGSLALDAALAQVDQKIPTWSVVGMRFTVPGAPINMTITDGAHWNRFARSTLTVDGRTAQVINWQPYGSSSAGQKLRGWLRFAHTGELGGLPGQLVAGIGCLGGVLLVYTGLALALRRFWRWCVRLREGLIPGAATEENLQAEAP